jgi:cytosine deaminase
MWRPWPFTPSAWGCKAVTTALAQILRLDDWGIALGKQASFVLLQATSVVEALRLRAHQLAVYCKSVKLASSPPQMTALNLLNGPIAPVGPCAGTESHAQTCLLF